MMSTAVSSLVGDREGNFKKLTRLLLKVHYPTLFARERVLEGDTATFIPMLRYALTGMSHTLSRKLLTSGYEIYLQPDNAFMECVYKVCVHYFHYYPVLQLLQFMHPPRGYAERKMVFVATVIQQCLNKHAELVREAKAAAAGSAGTAGASSKKKKQREEAQARLLTQVKRHGQPEEESSADTLRASVSSASSRRRSVSTERSSFSASSSSRARSASTTRGTSAATPAPAATGSLSTKKRSTPYATRPKTATIGATSSAAPAAAPNQQAPWDSFTQQHGISSSGSNSSGQEHYQLSAYPSADGEEDDEQREYETTMMRESGMNQSMRSRSRQASPVKKASVANRLRPRPRSHRESMRRVVAHERIVFACSLLCV